MNTTETPGLRCTSWHSSGGVPRCWCARGVPAQGSLCHLIKGVIDFPACWCYSQAFLGLGHPRCPTTGGGGSSPPPSQDCTLRLFLQQLCQVPAAARAPNLSSKESATRLQTAGSLHPAKLQARNFHIIWGTGLEVQGRKTPFTWASLGLVRCRAGLGCSIWTSSISTGEPWRKEFFLLNFCFYLISCITHILFSPLCSSSQRPLIRENTLLRAALQHALNFQHMLKLTWPWIRVRRARAFCRVGGEGVRLLFSHCSRWQPDSSCRAQLRAAAFWVPSLHTTMRRRDHANPPTSAHGAACLFS